MPEFRRRLLDGDTLFGTMLTLPATPVAEIMAAQGFDWLFIDCEHGSIETTELLGILQAIGDRSASLVRVAAADEVAIKKVLDLGATGVIVPQVNTAEQAADVVRFARYAPDGARGVGLSRAHGYGFSFREYLDSANEEVTVVVQCEHVDAVANIEAIVAVPGIDAVFLGPYDLSASLGKMGQVDDAEVVALIEHVTEVCQAAGMPLGYFGVTADAVAPYLRSGFQLIVAGVDTLFLGGGAADTLAQLKQASDV